MRVGESLFRPRPDTSRDRGGDEAAALVFEARRENAAPTAAPASAPVSSDGSSTRALTRTLAGMDVESRATKAKASGETAVVEFGKWAKMSPAERIRAQILHRHDLTEESLKALPKEEREAIETEIREAIKRAYGVKEKTGHEESAPDLTGPVEVSPA
ncbi:hypothetical protein GCM10011390_01170 [Aureimonas endophytica]|uniref:Uncharacterized protein n=1 Tax=Aureimonas endophytica TaxID=2027858 RepID=A0A916ZCS9_9HYPH|nr:hypothetical protein [Aureimonas endophytica]GGD86312.1 hypothetical protein GCM10011390_01170 [Aureimonas endophytica]